MFSSLHDESEIHVQSSLRGVKTSWQQTEKTSIQLLEKNIDPRILETTLPELLLECIHSGTTKSGRLAGRLFERAVQEDQTSATVMHMVRT